MAGYRYKQGDRPLAGYTVERAAGRGGFGEVYYAVSDGGREVALKAVQSFEQIEMRGITQCMNLKSPHLVTIFDVRHNDQGDPFVIMEFVAGPSLRELIDAAPGGLGTQKAAFFLREIGKGLSYLHDCGIVHRDLKPANIFYEDGYVKIGDYGLSKVMSADHHQSQTVTVGTVHYMAPEIGAGRYDRSIDIYALGCVLYEMLTGQVPYLGASPSEVLMKHLTCEPDVSSLEEPFRTVVRRSMAKDPAERYASVREMVEAVFGAEHVRDSVSHYAAEDLSMVAGRVGRKLNVGAGGGSGAMPIDETPGPRGGGESDSDAPDSWSTMTRRVDEAARRFERAGERFGHDLERQIKRHVGGVVGREVAKQGRPGRAVMPSLADPKRDPLGGLARGSLALVSIVTVVTATAFLFGGRDVPAAALLLHFAAAGAMVGLRASGRIFGAAIAGERGPVRWLAIGGPAAVLMLLFALPVLPALMHSVGTRNALGVLAALMLPLFVFDWHKRMAPGRAERLSIGQAAGPVLAAWVTSLFTTNQHAMVIGAMAAIALGAQVLAPFDPTVTDPADDEGEEDEPSESPSAPQTDHARAAGAHAAHATHAAHAATPGHVHPAPGNAGKSPAGDAGLDDASPRSRLIALLLSVAPLVMGFPVCGLQRFYAGKVGTGILWLLTLGFLGIGQLVDVILIATGTFEDADGRRLTVWWRGDGTERAGSAARSLPASRAARPVPRVNPLSVLLGLAGVLALLATVVPTLVLALQLPEMIAAGFPDPSLAAELTRGLGYADWPNLFHRIGRTAVFGLCVASAVLLMLSRRGGGAWHMMRAVSGVGLFFLACVMSWSVIPDWTATQLWAEIRSLVEGNQIGPAIERLLDAGQGRALVLMVLALVSAVVVLLWPASREVPLATRREGVER